MMLKAFENGADGVMVVGCLGGDCHFQTGNLRARKRVERVAGILDKAGSGKERVRMVNLSAGEGAKFVAYANEMIETIAKLGPSPINLVRSGQPVKQTQGPEAKSEGEQA